MRIENRGDERREDLGGLDRGVVELDTEAVWLTADDSPPDEDLPIFDDDHDVDRISRPRANSFEVGAARADVPSQGGHDFAGIALDLKTDRKFHDSSEVLPRIVTLCHS